VEILLKRASGLATIRYISLNKILCIWSRSCCLCTITTNNLSLKHFMMISVIN